MTVYLLNGEVYEHPDGRARIDDHAVLYVESAYHNGRGGDVIACYPLTSVARWTP